MIIGDKNLSDLMATGKIFNVSFNVKVNIKFDDSDKVFTYTAITAYKFTFDPAEDYIDVLKFIKNKRTELLERYCYDNLTQPFITLAPDGKNVDKIINTNLIREAYVELRYDYNE